MLKSCVSLACVLMVSTGVEARAATWAVVASPNLTADNLLIAADGTAATSVWAVGRAEAGSSPVERTLAMRWNGTSWSIPSMPVLPTGGSLYGVDGSTASNVWAVGTTNVDLGGGLVRVVTLTERWNGSLWQVVPSPSPAGSGFSALTGVKTFSASRAWAVGHATVPGGLATQTLTARWNGTSWAIVPSPNFGGFTNILEDVDGVSDTDAWAVGHTANSPDGGEQSLALRWDGRTWSATPLPPTESSARLTDVVAVTGNDVWAVGTRFSRQLFQWIPYAIHWNGTGWQEAAVPAPPGGGRFSSVTALSPSRVYAVGDTGTRTLAARWNGTAWTLETTPSPASGPALYGATAVGPGTVWAVGGRMDQLGNDRTLTLRTTNG